MMRDRDIFNDGHGFRPFQTHVGGKAVSSQDRWSRERDATLYGDDIIRGYNGSRDNEALSNFISATGLRDPDLVLDVYCKMLALNQSIRNASCRGVTIKLIHCEDLWLDSDFLMLSATRDGADVEFIT